MNEQPDQPIQQATRSRRPHPALRARRVTGLASVVGMLGITGYLASHAAESVAASAEAPTADLEAGSTTLDLDLTSADGTQAVDATNTMGDDLPRRIDNADGEHGDRRERGHRRHEDDRGNGYAPPSTVDGQLPRATDTGSTNNTNSSTATNPQSTSHGS